MYILITIINIFFIAFSIALGLFFLIFGIARSVNGYQPKSSANIKPPTSPPSNPPNQISSGKSIKKI